MNNECVGRRCVDWSIFGLDGWRVTLPAVSWNSSKCSPSTGPHLSSSPFPLTVASPFYAQSHASTTIGWWKSSPFWPGCWRDSAPFPRLANWLMRHRRGLVAPLPTWDYACTREQRLGWISGQSCVPVDRILRPFANFRSAFSSHCASLLKPAFKITMPVKYNAVKEGRKSHSIF